MLLLDTDIFLHLQADHPKVRRRFDAAGDVDRAITVVTRIEVLRSRFDSVLKADGTDDLKRAQGRLDATDQLLSEWRVLGISHETCLHFARLRHVKGLRKIGRADMLIASIALAYDATLVTRNVKDFELVPGLKVENWVD